MRSSRTNEPLIPRIIHRVWLGPDPVPEVLDYYEHSWRMHHPTWELRLWRDDTLPTLGCQARYDRAIGFKERYDILRLEILRQFGGVIIDMDVEAVRPLDPLLQGVEAFVGRIGRNHVGNQVLGAVPRHPFFELAVARLDATVGVAQTASRTAGKDFLQQLLAEHPHEVTIFPPETFYYEPSFDPPRRPEEFPQVYAVHHELATYSTPMPQKAMERRFAKFRKALTALRADARVEQVEARLDEAERRLRRGVEKHEHGLRAQLRRVEAEREQAEARLRDAHLQALQRVEALEKQLAVTTERLARLERRSIITWARKLVTPRRAAGD